MTKTLDQLLAEQRETNQALAKLENKKRYEENAPLLGKTFKYRNCYSCPEKPSDYWSLYAKVTKVDKDGYLKVFTFETDRHGHINIRVDDYRHHMNDGYKPIPAAEYARALKALKSRVGKL